MENQMTQNESEIKSESNSAEKTNKVESAPDTATPEQQKANIIRGFAKELGFDSVKDFKAFVEASKAPAKPESNPELDAMKTQVSEHKSVLNELANKAISMADKEFVELFTSNNPEFEDLEPLTKWKVFQKEHAYYQTMKTKLTPKVEAKPEVKAETKKAPPGVSAPSGTETVDKNELLKKAMSTGISDVERKKLLAQVYGK